MRAGAGELVAEPVAERDQGSHPLLELAPDGRHVVADVGVQLYRRLNQLGLHVRVLAAGLQDAGRARDEVARLGIENLQLELDAEGRFRGAVEADAHGPPGDGGRWPCRSRGGLII